MDALVLLALFLPCTQLTVYPRVLLPLATTHFVLEGRTRRTSSYGISESIVMKDMCSLWFIDLFNKLNIY